MIMRNKEWSPIKESWLSNKFFLSALKEMYKEQYEDYAYWY